MILEYIPKHSKSKYNSNIHESYLNKKNAISVACNLISNCIYKKYQRPLVVK